MVSGFLTSPCDQRRMSSAVASPILSCSNMLTSSMFQFLVRVSRCCSYSPRRALAIAIAVVVVGAALRTVDIDAELLGGAEDLVVEIAHLDLAAIVAEHLDVDAECLHLLHQHLEALGHAGLGDVVALDDRLVDLDATEHVVGLDRQQLLQAVSRAVRLERP